MKLSLCLHLPTAKIEQNRGRVWLLFSDAKPSNKVNQIAVCRYKKTRQNRGNNSLASCVDVHASVRTYQLCPYENKWLLKCRCFASSPQGRFGGKPLAADPLLQISDTLLTHRLLKRRLTPGQPAGYHSNKNLSRLKEILEAINST